MIKILLLLPALLLAGCSSPKLAPLPQDAVILAFGDSITYGTGAGEGENYPAVLQGLLGRTVVRSGVSGETTVESLRRLPEVLDAEQPKLMVLCIGGNDFLHRLSEQQAADNIRAMVRLTQAKGVAVVLVGVPQFGWSLSPPRFYRDIAQEFNLPYEGDVMHEILLSRDLKADEVHPNAKGYRVFAEAVAALLKKAGAIGKQP